MKQFIFLAILVGACVAGCKKEKTMYEESIPVIPPSTRGVGGGALKGLGSESKKVDAAEKGSNGTKGGAIAP